MENNITDKSHRKFEGFQNKVNNAAGSTDIFTLTQDVEECLEEGDKNQTNLGPQVYLHCRKSIAISKHLLYIFKFNCVGV